jgi:hypothetical protein
MVVDVEFKDDGLTIADIPPGFSFTLRSISLSKGRKKIGDCPVSKFPNFLYNKDMRQYEQYKLYRKLKIKNKDQSIEPG